VYVLKDASGLTVIDTSIPGAGGRIARDITSAGLRLSDVKRILITHAHPDHNGGLARLRELTGAQVIASAGEKPVIEGKAPIVRPDPATLTGVSRYIRMPAQKVDPCLVDQVVRDGDMIDAFGGLRVISTPGHSPDHISFFQPERRILFCGDAVWHLLGWTLPPAPLTVDMAENIRSVGKLSALEARVICFGHGPPVTVNAVAQLTAFARKHNAVI
jgi:glyoxylase-like metal-dependent hydrolase (beta-lactamase superfamily II)